MSIDMLIIVNDPDDPLSSQPHTLRHSSKFQSLLFKSTVSLKYPSLSAQAFVYL